MHKLILTTGLILLAFFISPLSEATWLFSTAEAYEVKVDTFKQKDQVITGATGVELWKNFTSEIYKAGAGIIGVVCVLIIVFSGIQISLGGLSSEGVNQAKERIMQALLSLILLFGAALLLRVINPGFFGPQENVNVDPPEAVIEEPPEVPEAEDDTDVDTVG